MVPNTSSDLTDDQKKDMLDQILGKETSSALLAKYGTYAYDIYMNLGQYASKGAYAPFVATRKKEELLSQFLNSTMTTDLALDIINSAADRDPYALSLLPKKDRVTAADIDASAAQYAPAPTPAPAHSLSEAELTKLSNFLTRTIGSSDMTEALAAKFGDKAYAVALSAVMEPGAMVTDLGIKVDGAFSSKNLLTTLSQESTQIDNAKLTTFLDGYSERKSQRDAEREAREAAEREAREAAERAARRPVLPNEPMPDISSIRLNVDTVAIPENIEIKNPIKSLPYVQDGKVYDLYNLPDGFVIKGDLDLSNRGLKELPDLSHVKVKGSLLLSGNELTSIDGVLPEVGKNIDLRHNKLTSLKGMPEKVKGHFSCEGNQLTTLEGAPKKVEGAFDCRNNRLTTLEGSPQKVGGAYICSDNMLTSLKGVPSEIKSNFDCHNNQLTSLADAPQSIAGDFMADDTLSANLARDMKNAVKIAGAKHFLSPTAPSADDARIDQAFARRNKDEQSNQSTLQPFSIENMMADIHSYRGK